MQRGGTRHLLQVGLRQADITTAPESTHASPWGERALNARALRLELATFVALKRGSHPINGGLLELRLQREAARLGFGRGDSAPVAGRRPNPLS
jgi:hypothetical protein